MFVRIGSDGSIGLLERDDYKKLSVMQVGETPSALVDATLRSAGAGRLVSEPPGHAALSVNWLRAFQRDETSRMAFDAMVDYAARKGWMIELGSMILAHIHNADDHAFPG